MLFRDYILHKEPREAAVLSERMTAALAVTCRPHQAPAELLGRTVLSALVAFVDGSAAAVKSAACTAREPRSARPSFRPSTRPAITCCPPSP